MKLMKDHSFRKGAPKIVKSEFDRFPIESDFRPWFDVDTVANGELITGDDWIYAVIDRDRGRLYYYNSH